jgi:hypothetical protein
MRQKTRGLVQHGGLAGWLEESDPAGCVFVRDERSTHLSRPGADLLLNAHRTPS